MFSATPVPALPSIDDLGLLVHPRGVVADVAVDGHRTGASRPTATLCAPAGCSMTKSPVRSGACRAALTSRSGVVAQVESRVTVRPCVDHLRLGLPDRGVLDAGKACQRAVFAGHRHPVVGLGDDRGLAGDGVAHHGERVAVGHQQRVEAVERRAQLLQRGLARRGRRRAAWRRSGRRPRCRSRCRMRHPRRAVRAGWWRGWRTSRCAPCTARARRRRGGSPAGSPRTRWPSGCARRPASPAPWPAPSRRSASAGARHP